MRVSLEEPLLKHCAAERVEQVSHRKLRTLAHSWRQRGGLQDPREGNACAQSTPSNNARFPFFSNLH